MVSNQQTGLWKTSSFAGETKQEEHSRQMAELQSRPDHLKQENDRLRACLKGKQIENARGSSHPTPTVKQNKGKEPIRPDDNDATANDELSFGNYPLPPKNNVEAESRKRPLRRFNRSVSDIPRRARREFSRERGDSRSKSLKIYPRGRGA